jgi:hypothetical protein
LFSRSPAVDKAREVYSGLERNPLKVLVKQQAMGKNRKKG